MPTAEDISKFIQDDNDELMLTVCAINDGKNIAIAHHTRGWNAAQWGLVLSDIARNLTLATTDNPRLQAEFLVELKRSFDKAYADDNMWPAKDTRKEE